MSRLWIIATTVGLAVVGHAQAILVTYDFESGSLPAVGSDITGYDNWRAEYGGSYSAGTLQTGVGSNSSQVLGLASGTFGNAGYGSRVNNGAFHFNIDFTSTEYIFQFDVKWGSNVRGALGVDQGGVAGDGTITDSVGQEHSGWLILQASNLIYMDTDVGLIGTTVSTPANGDWVRIRNVIDWTKNFAFTQSGINAYDGAGSIFYQDLTAGDTSFTPVAGLQNRDLGGLTGNWTYYAQLYAGYQGIATQVYDPGSQMDNITVGIPEPSAMALLALGGLALLGTARRRQRS